MEENLLDTSKLIDAFLKKESIHGWTTILNIIEFPKAMDLNIKIIYPSKSDYNLAIKMSTDLLRIGKPIPAVDLIIAAVALNRGFRLITKDKHFLNVKEIREDFKIAIEG